MQRGRARLCPVPLLWLFKDSLEKVNRCKCVLVETVQVFSFWTCETKVGYYRFVLGQVAWPWSMGLSGERVGGWWDQVKCGSCCPTPASALHRVHGDSLLVASHWSSTPEQHVGGSRHPIYSYKSGQITAVAIVAPVKCQIITKCHS